MIPTIRYKYNSLEDFLISNPLNIDGMLDDGWGAIFPVKGIEIEASILFSDITSFSRRSLDLNPIETLIFVNNFFSWITAEALRDRPGIVDKYIGDEIMVIFSKEFGSNDPFIDAVQTARWMAEHDILDFGPHMGIASGNIVVGYVGTLLKYNCSVFGIPVTLAARCASIKSQGMHSTSIIFPASLWKNYSLDEILPPMKYTKSTGEIIEQQQIWKLLPKRTEKIKNMPDIEVIEIVNQLINLPNQSPEERARKAFEMLKKAGYYRKFINK